MILLHRITSFAIAALTVIGFVLLITMPQNGILSLILMLVLVPILFARLLNFDVKRTSFWVFFGVPTFFILSSLFFYLFLEADYLRYTLGIIVSLGAWLYAENLFAFYHLPSTYQAYALEYLSLVLYVLSGFFFASGAYAVQMFLQLPIWVPALAVFWVTVFATAGVFWVSKIGTETSTRFAISGAIIMTELFLVIALLPNGFLTKAGIFAVMMYMYLGLSRLHVLESISSKSLISYLGTATLLLCAIFASATWI